VIAIIGGAPVVTQTITFSRPVRDPVMAVLSMGASGRPMTYEFDAPFDLISNGPGYWGNGPLTARAGNVLEGQEGHGVIRFRGTFTSISWTVPTAEGWNGYTFGIDRGAACAADFNGDGFLDFFDYDDYVSCFEAGSCPEGRTADFNGDGFADFFDYDDFVTAFELGC
jgi:hypothetical protein